LEFYSNYHLTLFFYGDEEKEGWKEKGSQKKENSEEEKTIVFSLL